MAALSLIACAGQWRPPAVMPYQEADELLVERTTTLRL